MTDREALTSALAGPLVNARATSAGVAPCAPTPGSRSTDCGSSRRASPTARGWVAPMTAPTLESPRSPTSSAPHSATSAADVLPERPPVREGEVLDLRAARVRGLDEAEDPAAVRGGRRRGRLDRVAARGTG